MKIKTTGSGTPEEIINSLNDLIKALIDLSPDQLPVTLEDKTLCSEIIE